MNRDYQDMSLFDFIVLCIKKLKAFFVWIAHLFHCLFASGLRYWYVVIAFVVLGVLYARFFVNTPEPTFIGRATILIPNTIKPTIENGLNLFVQLPPDQRGVSSSATLVDIKVYNAIDARNDGSEDFIDKDYTVDAADSIKFVMMDRIAVEIELTGDSSFSAYEDAIVNYFHTNAEYSEPARRWRLSMERRIAYLDRQIESSDSCCYDLLLQRERLAESLAATPDVVNFQTHCVVSPAPLSGPGHKYRWSALAALVLGLLVSCILTRRKEFLHHLHNL